MDRLQELVRLHRMGTGAREVARLLRMGPNTERDYRSALAAAGLLDGSLDELPELEVLKAAVQQHLAKAPPAQMTSSLADWEPRILKLAEDGLTAKPIFDRLRLEDPDFRGSFYAVRAVWRRWRKARGVRAEDVAIPVEVVAGDIAQIDFGYVGKLYDATVGRLRKAWVFVLVLAYSRLMFARVVFDQTIETWLRMHVEAFAALGAVPRTLVPDNLKAAVIRAAFGVDEPASLNRSYRELARYYGCRIDPTPPRAPQKKGRVESGVGTSSTASSPAATAPTRTRQLLILAFRRLAREQPDATRSLLRSEIAAGGANCLDAAMLLRSIDCTLTVEELAAVVLQFVEVPYQGWRPILRMIADEAVRLSDELRASEVVRRAILHSIEKMAARPPDAQHDALALVVYACLAWLSDVRSEYTDTVFRHGVGGLASGDQNRANALAEVLELLKRVEPQRIRAALTQSESDESGFVAVGLLLSSFFPSAT